MSGDEGGKDTPNIAAEIEQFARSENFIVPGFTKQYRIEPEGLLLVMEDNRDKVFRIHFSRRSSYPVFQSMGIVAIENYGKGVYKAIMIRRGSSHLGEGTQAAFFQQGGRNGVQMFTPDADIDIDYDEKGDILKIGYGRFMPARLTLDDEAESNESVSVNFRVENRPKIKQTPSGTFQIIDGGGFVECVKIVDGEAVLRYRVPKKINRDEILAKLVPADLRDYPYEAPAAADTSWFNTDLLAAFGIEKLP